MSNPTDLKASVVTFELTDDYLSPTANPEAFKRKPEDIATDCQSVWAQSPDTIVLTENVSAIPSNLNQKILKISYDDNFYKTVFKALGKKTPLCFYLPNLGPTTLAGEKTLSAILEKFKEKTDRTERINYGSAFRSESMRKLIAFCKWIDEKCGGDVNKAIEKLNHSSDVEDENSPPEIPKDFLDAFKTGQYIDTVSKKFQAQQQALVEQLNSLEAIVNPKQFYEQYLSTATSLLQEMNTFKRENKSEAASLATIEGTIKTLCELALIKAQLSSTLSIDDTSKDPIENQLQTLNKHLKNRLEEFNEKKVSLGVTFDISTLVTERQKEISDKANALITAAIKNINTRKAKLSVNLNTLSLADAQPLFTSFKKYKSELTAATEQANNYKDALSFVDQTELTNAIENSTEGTLTIEQIQGHITQQQRLAEEQAERERKAAEIENAKQTVLTTLETLTNLLISEKATAKELFNLHKQIQTAKKNYNVAKTVLGSRQDADEIARAVENKIKQKAEALIDAGVAEISTLIESTSNLQTDNINILNTLNIEALLDLYKAEARKKDLMQLSFANTQKVKAITITLPSESIKKVLEEGLANLARWTVLITLYCTDLQETLLTIEETIVQLNPDIESTFSQKIKESRDKIKNFTPENLKKISIAEWGSNVTIPFKKLVETITTLGNTTISERDLYKEIKPLIDSQLQEIDQIIQLTQKAINALNTVLADKEATPVAIENAQRGLEEQLGALLSFGRNEIASNAVESSLDQLVALRESGRALYIDAEKIKLEKLAPEHLKEIEEITRNIQAATLALQLTLVNDNKTATSINQLTELLLDAEMHQPSFEITEYSPIEIKEAKELLTIAQTEADKMLMEAGTAIEEIEKIEAELNRQLIAVYEEISNTLKKAGAEPLSDDEKTTLPVIDGALSKAINLPSTTAEEARLKIKALNGISTISVAQNLMAERLEEARTIAFESMIKKHTFDSQHENSMREIIKTNVQQYINENIQNIIAMQSGIDIIPEIIDQLIMRVLNEALIEKQDATIKNLEKVYATEDLSSLSKILDDTSNPALNIVDALLYKLDDETTIEILVAHLDMLAKLEVQNSREFIELDNTLLELNAERLEREILTAQVSIDEIFNGEGLEQLSYDEKDNLLDLIPELQEFLDAQLPDSTSSPTETVFIDKLEQQLNILNNFIDHPDETLIDILQARIALERKKINANLLIYEINLQENIREENDKLLSDRGSLGINTRALLNYYSDINELKQQVSLLKKLNTDSNARGTFISDILKAKIIAAQEMIQLFLQEEGGGKLDLNNIPFENSSKYYELCNNIATNPTTADGLVFLKSQLTALTDFQRLGETEKNRFLKDLLTARIKKAAEEKFKLIESDINPIKLSVDAKEAVIHQLTHDTDDDSALPIEGLQDVLKSVTINNAENIEGFTKITLQKQFTTVREGLLKKLGEYSLSNDVLLALHSLENIDENILQGATTLMDDADSIVPSLQTQVTQLDYLSKNEEKLYIAVLQAHVFIAQQEKIQEINVALESPPYNDFLLATDAEIQDINSTLEKLDSQMQEISSRIPGAELTDVENLQKQKLQHRQTQLENYRDELTIFDSNLTEIQPSPELLQKQISDITEIDAADAAREIVAQRKQLRIAELRDDIKSAFEEKVRPIQDMLKAAMAYDRFSKDEAALININLSTAFRIQDTENPPTLEELEEILEKIKAVEIEPAMVFHISDIILRGRITATDTKVAEILSGDIGDKAKREKITWDTPLHKKALSQWTTEDQAAKTQKDNVKILQAAQKYLTQLEKMCSPEKTRGSLQKEFLTQAIILHAQDKILERLNKPQLATPITLKEVQEVKDPRTSFLMLAIADKSNKNTLNEVKLDTLKKELIDATRDDKINSTAEKMLTAVLCNRIKAAQNSIIDKTRIEQSQLSELFPGTKKDEKSDAYKMVEQSLFVAPKGKALLSIESQEAVNKRLKEHLEKLLDPNLLTSIENAQTKLLQEKVSSFNSHISSLIAEKTGLEPTRGCALQALNEAATNSLPLSEVAEPYHTALTTQRIPNTKRAKILADMRKHTDEDIAALTDAIVLRGAIFTLREHLLPEHIKRSFDNNNEDHHAWMTSDTSQLSNDQLKVLLNNLNWYNRLLNPISYEQVDSLANAFSADEHSKIADLLSSADYESKFALEDSTAFDATPASEKHVTYNEGQKCLTAKYNVSWTEKNDAGADEKKETSVELRRSLSEDNKERKVTWHVASKAPISWEMESAMVARDSLKVRIAEKQMLGEKITRLEGSVSHMVNGSQKDALKRQLDELQNQFDKFDPTSISLNIKNDPGKKENHTLTDGKTVCCTKNAFISMKAHFKAGYKKICIDNIIYTNPNQKLPEETAASSAPSTPRGRLPSVVENKVTNKLEDKKVQDAASKKELFVQIEFNPDTDKKLKACRFEDYLKANVKALAAGTGYVNPVVVAVPMIMNKKEVDDFCKKHQVDTIQEFLNKLGILKREELGLPTTVSVVPLITISDDDSNADNLKDEAQEKLIKHIEDGNPVLCCARPGEEGLISGDSAAFKDVLMAVQEAANPRSRSRSLSLSSDDDGE